MKNETFGKPAASEWQPPESAPRDGTYILALMKSLYGEDERPHVDITAYDVRNHWWQSLDELADIRRGEQTLASAAIIRYNTSEWNNTSY